jgi:two-component system sensor histidine kinase KdpD
MLEAAQRRKAEGTDLVIGWVETHGRPETAALTTELEQVPARQTEYKGTRLREFDIDASLARRPALVLLDELAHTNAPGSRHLKRWQDVRELLDAGIEVFTTLNVQHVESLNDVVGRITGVVVRETVPDRVLDEADEIEFVDLPPEDLLQRMAEGKVYVPEQAAQAVQNFFRRGNLIALRELALRRTAERVDAQMQSYRRDHEIREIWPVAERLLVCVRPNPESDRLVRAARRMAASLHAEWIVVSVESPSQPPLSAQERQSLAATMRLAEDLGAETAVLSGPSVSGALVEYAQQRNVSKIVVGKPTHSRWYDRLRGSLLDALVRRSGGGIDVYIISPEREEEERPRRARRWQARAPALHYVWATGVVLLCTLVCWAMFGHFDNSNLIMVYLLGVAFVAVRFGRVPSALAACLSVAAFDFFFVPPYLTFAVSDTQYVVTFGVMLTVGLLISTLAVRLRDQAQAARERESRTQVLYGISRDLGALRATEEIAKAVVRHATDLCRGSAALLLPGADRRLAAAAGEAGLVDEPKEQAVAQWAFDNGRPAGLGTDTLPDSSALYLPVHGSRGVLGVLAVRPDASLLPLSPSQVDLLDTLARQAAAPLERAELAKEIEQARLAAESERLRSTLLSSVSHDLRTPLAAITGAATSLQQAGASDESVRRELIDTIAEESARLSRLVTNLLDMTRLESGFLELNREWHPVEEIVGSALARVEGLAGQRRIETSLPTDLPLVSIDATLVEQVLVNLLENAFKYAGPESSVSIAARPEEGSVVLEVADEGPGLPPGTEERVFEKFYRGPSGERGFGLGLAICRAILTAHGGRIWAENRRPKGTVFRFALPLDGVPPSAPEDTAERGH